MSTTLAHALITGKEYRIHPTTGNEYEVTLPPRIIPVLVDAIGVESGVVRYRTLSALDYEDTRRITTFALPVYSTLEAAESALAALAKAYEKENAALLKRQRECEEIMAPHIAEILQQLNRLPATRGPRIAETDGLVVFKLHHKEKDLLRMADRPNWEYRFLRYPPNLESKRTFVSRETKYLKESLAEITEIVDFLTSPEITKMFPEIYK